MDQQVTVTEVVPGVYRVFSLYSKDTLAMTAAELLQLAALIEARKADLIKQKAVSAGR